MAQKPYFSYASKGGSSSSRGGSSSYGSRSGGSGRPSRGFQGRSGGFGGSRGGYGRKKSTLNPLLLVKKATPKVEQAPYEPKHAFADFPFVEQIQENIAHKGYTTPTPIQDQAIPAILEGKDVVGLANTGTGKTAAFLLPLINAMASNLNLRVLIVAPTRELAVQIQTEARSFAMGMPISTQLCIGGVNIRPQVSGLRRRPQIVVGTPGRLKDLSNQRALFFQDYSMVVLDEVDRMLDMGFIHDVQYIIGKLPKDRQSLFFSATLNPESKKLMGDFLTDPVMVSVKSQETAMNVDQDVVRLLGRTKVDVLDEILRTDEAAKVIIFGRTKHGIDKLAKQLGERGLKIASIHGNKSQYQRQQSLELFKHNRVNVLLATDVAARGLDIDDVSHVINYDLPDTYEEYVHRIGRTGRANKTGKALSFVD